MPVDLEGLRRLYSEHATARGFLDCIANRPNNQSQTTVDRTLDVLAENEIPASRQQVIEIFRNLETLGCGVFKHGRRGHRSRLEWSVPCIGVAQAATGESHEVGEYEDEPVELLTHSYFLRPDMPIEIDLPVDMTLEEAKRLAAFVETLAFDR